MLFNSIFLIIGEWVTSFQIRRDSYFFPSSNIKFKTPSCIQDFGLRSLHQMNIYLKAPEHEYIFSKYSRNLNISEIFWECYTKNNLPVIFTKYKKNHFLTSVEIWNFTFQIKPVWFEIRNFLMKLKKIYWNWGISFAFKSKHT